MTSKKLYCINCGKNGHLVKECIEPIFSYGIICMKIDNKLNVSPQLIENFLVSKLVDLEEFNFTNLTNLSKIDYYKDKIKFLFIQRKHSFSYVEFIRGKYNENNKLEISSLLNLMNQEEIEKILTNNLNFLWSDLWNKTSKYKHYQKEFELSQEKFNFIKTKYNLLELINFNGLYETPEWGFPKGRRDRNEKNLDCATREFEEETGIISNKYLILNRLNTIEENVVGTHHSIYKLVYYLAVAYDECELNMSNTNEYQKCEIGDIKWLTFEEIIPKVRPYFKEKIKMIYKVYFLMINLIETIVNEKGGLLLN
jgi:8-oxo-dGTP pyrophosphatase MutT (NUDIX family)